MAKKPKIIGGNIFKRTGWVHTKSRHERGYGNDWDRLRRWHLSRFPLCVVCLDQGKTKAATHVHHIRSFAHDDSLRLNSSNLQSLCERHHMSHTAVESHGGGGAKL